MAEWHTAAFGDVLSGPIRSGINAPTSVRGVGVPLINMGELFRYDRIGDIEMDLAPLPAGDPSKYLVEEGDLLFARQSLTVEGAGKCSIVQAAEGPRTWEGHILRARPDRSTMDARFLYYWFRSPQGRAAISSIVEQVAAAGVRGSDLARLYVPVPLRPEQEVIADTLGSLDDKIESNRRLARLLEQEVRTLFQRLFDVGPQGSGIAVPELIDVNPRRRLPTGAVGVYIDMAAMPTGQALVERIQRRTAGSGQRFISGDVLMARITPCLENGKVAFVDTVPAGEVGWGSTEFIVFRSRPHTPDEWTYCLVRSKPFIEFAVRNMSGTSGRQRCPASAFDSYRLPSPDSRRVEIFRDVAVPSFRRMGSARDESNVLTGLRDALLPELLSGRLRVPDAEELVESVT